MRIAKHALLSVITLEIIEALNVLITYVIFQIEVQSGDIDIQYETTAKQIADIFIKELDPVIFYKFRDRLIVSRAMLNRNIG